MSKMGNYRVELQEDPDYEWGWQSAERGEPKPDWPVFTKEGRRRFDVQTTGWLDYHCSEDGQ